MSLLTPRHPIGGKNMDEKNCEVLTKAFLSPVLRASRNVVQRQLDRIALTLEVLMQSLESSGIRMLTMAFDLTCRLMNLFK